MHIPNFTETQAAEQEKTKSRSQHAPSPYLALQLLQEPLSTVGFRQSPRICLCDVRDTFLIPNAGLTGRMPQSTAQPIIFDGREIVRFAVPGPPMVMLRPRNFALRRSTVLPSLMAVFTISMSALVTSATFLIPMSSRT